MGSRRRLYILDSSLCEVRGHHYELTKLITSIALKSNMDVKWLTNKRFENEIENIEVFNIFTTSMYDKKNDGLLNIIGNKLESYIVTILHISMPPGLISIIRKIKRHILRNIINQKFSVNRWHGETESVNNYIQLSIKEKINRNDIVLSHTATGDVYRLILDLLLVPEIAENPPVFHLVTPYDNSVMPEYETGMVVNKVIKYLKLLGYLNNKVYLHAENEYLAEYLTSLWDTKVNLLQLPVSTIKINENMGKKEIINVVYLGAARVEKGFLMLPDIINEIMKGDHKNMIMFTIQCTPQIVGYSPEIRRTIKKLNKYSEPFVKLIKHSLSTNEYQSLLGRSDIVLLCYDKEKYKVRGSGIATEAVAAGKIVIAREGTYPSHLAASSCISINNVNDIVNAIGTVVDKYDEYHNNALSNAFTFRKKYSSENYLNTLINLPGQCDQTSLVKDKDNMLDTQALNIKMQNMIKYPD